MRFRTRSSSGRLLLPAGLGLLALLMLCGALLSAPRISMAYDPPPDWSNVEWQPISCDGVGDPQGEAGIGKDAFDLVCESADAISAYYYWDANFLYLRERVDGRPSKTKSGPGSNEFGQFAWVVLVTLPGETPDYFQYLVNVNGMDDTVEIWENTVVEAPIYEWRDEADTLLWFEPTGDVGPGYTNGLARYLEAPTSCAGNPDYFVDWAIPISALITTGVIDEPGDLDAFTDDSFFFATSADQNNYNKDYLDCRIPQAELLIDKVVDPVLIAEGVTTPLTYTIGVTNISDFGARMVNVVDDSPFPSWIVCGPPSVTFGDPASSGIYTNTVNSAWDPIDVLVDPLVPGDTATITLLCDATPPIGSATAPDITFTNIACASAVNAPDLVCDPADLTVEEAPAMLTLVKTVIGGNLTAADFPAYIDGGSVAWGATNEVEANVQHTASEDEQSDYTASDWGGDCNADGTITLLPGEDKTCTITNTRKTGSLEVVKDVDPDAPTTNWVMDVTGPSSFSDTLTGDDSTGARSVDTGAYTIVESAGSGTNLALYDTTYACSIDGSPTGPSGSGYTINVDVGDGQVVVCTFTNTRKTASLEVVKDVDPDAPATNWVMDVTGPSPFSDTLTGDDSTGARSVDTGAYTIVESAGSGTDLSLYDTTYACTIDGSPTGPSGSGYTINVNVGGDQVVVCTFTNTRKTGSLEVVKDVIPDAPTTNWVMDVTGPSPFSDTLTGDDSTGARSVDTGAYTIVESAGSGTDLSLYDTTYACTIDGSPTGPSGSGYAINVDVGEGQVVVCTFTNTAAPACIEIVKTGDSCAHPGEGISYSFWVHNCGDFDLEDVTVTDPLFGSAWEHVVGDLAADDGAAGGPDEAIFNEPYTVPSGASEGPMPNTATVEGTDVLGRTVDDNEGHEVDILRPCIEVKKTHLPSKRANGKFFPGDKVTYVFKVTNCSADTRLNNVTVVDEWVTPYSGQRFSKNLGSLGAGRNKGFSWVYTIPKKAEAGLDLVNKVTAFGVDDCDGTVDDTARDSLPVGQPSDGFVPEWDSILLLASGLGPLAGYASMRLRKRR